MSDVTRDAIAGVRVRFCPSPTGSPHVGLARTALFNWAFARHHGGTFVFRIEDTDAARDSEESYTAILDVLRWLGLSWDEGPEIGGPHAPYRQSQRMDIYADVARRLHEGGYAYECFCTPEELDERRELARAEGRPSGYDGHCRALTDEQRESYRSEGREAVLRFKMPGTDLTFTDLVRGELTFGAEHVSDYVIVRANGQPLYTLVNPVDDALMGITHVLRGEDLLSSTPRQLALHAALSELGIGDSAGIAFGHLPYVMGEGNRKLSKRDPESHLLRYRERGFLPEGLLNYLALLGWAIADDHDIFSLQEMVEAFEIGRVNPNPARFDLKKCEAINATHIRALSTEEFVERALPYLQLDGLVDAEPTVEQLRVVTAMGAEVRDRITVLGEVSGMLAFLLEPEESFAVEEDALGSLKPDAGEALRVATDALRELPNWAAPEIEAALRSALVDGLGLKPKFAFAPVRVGITGKRVSPPLFESMEVLGRERSLNRLSALAPRLA